MKILVATDETQGTRSNDFCFVPDGEPVVIGISCDRDYGNPDGFCGCFRDFNGIETFRGTTTAKVVELDITFDEYLTKILEYIKSYGPSIAVDETSLETQEEIHDMAYQLIGIASLFDVGAIIEKRGFKFKERFTNVTYL